MNTYSRKLTAEEQQELEWVIKEAKHIAKLHKKLDIKIAKEAFGMRLDEIEVSKKKLSELAKSLRSAVSKVIKLGGTWDNEKERAVA